MLSHLPAGQAGKATVEVDQTSPNVTTTHQGLALISAGSVKVHVSYPTIQAYPYVQVTPRGDVEEGWWADNYTDVGFDIALNRAQARDVLFTWRVDAISAETKVFLSDGTAATVDPTSGAIKLPEVVQVASTPEVAPAPSTEAPIEIAVPSLMPPVEDEASIATSPEAVLPEMSTSTSAVVIATSTSL